MVLNLAHLLIGFGLAAIIALAAYRVNALNRSGSLAALLLGTIVFGLGGFSWAVVLMVFFITSSGLSRLFHQRKNANSVINAKGSRRDAAQVLANGGIAGLAVLLHLVFPGEALPWLVFTGSLAAANADTWATELGILNRSWPRSLRNWKRVPPGTSGGISLAGMLAAAAGAGTIALAAVLLWPNGIILSGSRFIFALIIMAGGFIGSLLDSLAGATIQAIYWCPNCRKETEQSPFHSCGAPTNRLRGAAWLGNDLVNLICTGGGALFAIFASRF